jgi:hypothetical protein
MTYFVIQGTEDGTHIEACANDAQVREYLRNNGLTNFQKEFSDTNYWGDETCLIIEGDIIVPKPKKVVEEWEL